MKTYEYSPFKDAYVPYLLTPELDKAQRTKLFWETLPYAPLPFLTRWILYHTLRALR